MSRKLLNLFLTASLLFAPSISFATDVMTRCYSKTISALDSYTKLLIHGDSIGDATGKTVTANGNAAVTTAQYKFAELGRSLVFDGTGDYLSLADSDDWWFDNQDFTIDCWVRLTSPSAAGYIIYSQWVGAGTTDYVQLWVNSTTLGFNVKSSDITIMDIYQSFTFSADTWYHVAVVRNGNDLFVFQNGVKGSTVDVTGVTFPNFGADLNIGRRNYPSSYSYFNGWLSMVRISKGTARWTSNFTPPTAPYDGARTVINITGLDGNTDEEYEFVCRFIDGFGENCNYHLQPNGDSNSANFGSQYIDGRGTSISADRQTSTYYGFLLAYGRDLNAITMSKAILYAKSGYIRSLLNTYADGISGTTVSVIRSLGQVWNNTLDNITSLVIFANQTNGLGVGTNIELYKKSAKQ